jgi:hypothetical protein
MTPKVFEIFASFRFSLLGGISSGRGFACKSSLLSGLSGCATYADQGLIKMICSPMGISLISH